MAYYKMIDKSMTATQIEAASDLDPGTEYHASDTLKIYTVSDAGEAENRGTYGELYISSSAATSVATVSTPLKAAGTTTTGDLSLFDDDTGTNNRLKYKGTEPKVFHVLACISMTSASNNITFNIYIYVYDDSGASGAVITSSKIQRKIGTGADIGALSTQTLVLLDTDDYVEVWVENITDDSNCTFDLMNLTIK